MEAMSMETAIARITEQSKPFPMQPPCPEGELRALPAKVERELGASLPERYLDLLRIANGFEYNALRVFGNRTARSLASDLEERELVVLGIVEANVMFRTDYDYYDYSKLLIFAGREGYVYAQVLESGLFEKEATRPARPLVRGKFVKQSQTEDEPRKVYETFDEMMIDAIQDALAN